MLLGFVDPFIHQRQVVAHLFGLVEIGPGSYLVELIQAHPTPQEIEVGVVALRRFHAAQVGRCPEGLPGMDIALGSVQQDAGIGVGFRLINPV